MAERASEVRTLMPCPQCGRALYPIGVDASITFHCKSCHEWALGDLLRAQSASVSGGLQELLAEWSRQHAALIQTVEDARKRGFLNVADIFHRHAKSLESRICKVRDAFTQHDSTKLIELPAAVRSAGA